MADVTLPQLGETVTEGTITQWFKKVGDTVAADEPLFEVSTDKVDTEVPSPVAGVVTEIRAAEGDTIEVGTVVAVVGDSAGAAAPTPAPAAPASENATAPSAPTEAAPEPAPTVESAPAAEASAAPTREAEPASAPQAESATNADASSAPLPAPAPSSPATASPTADDSRLLSPVVRRLVNEHQLNPDDIPGTGAGGRITRDDVMDYIDRTGAKPVAATGAGQGSNGASVAAAGSTASSPAGTSSGGVAAAAGTVAAVASTSAAASSPAAASPATASGATASGANSGTASASTSRPSAGERDKVIKLSKIRQLTGAHMIMSKATSPHAFSVVEVDFANVDVTRNKVKGDFKSSEGFSLTYLPFTARAIVDALAAFPNMNASVDGDQLVVHNYVDLAIAVDLDYEGLLAPVIRDAESKRLRAIAREISDLANRARNRKLSPDEISGGTFTISNNGSAGSVLTMPIINQPQVAIISTDAIVRRPVVVTAADGSETIGIHPVGNIAMSWDHRAFDGAYAAGFLKKVKEILETRDWGTEL